MYRCPNTGKNRYVFVTVIYMVRLPPPLRLKPIKKNCDLKGKTY
jgi:hypothetical protein